MSQDDLRGAPPVYSAVLSAERLRELFDDIEAKGRDVQARLKSRQAGLSSESTVTLTEARHAIGTGVAAQIRYGFNGEQWCDTLRRTPQGIQLIRCRSASDV